MASIPSIKLTAAGTTTLSVTFLASAAGQSHMLQAKLVQGQEQTVVVKCIKQGCECAGVPL